MSGASSLRKVYDIYQRPDKNEIPMDRGVIDKIKTHYIDVFMSCIVKMNNLVLSRKPVEESDYNKKIFVEYLLTDWSLAEELYSKIIEFTYGKKKTKFFVSQRIR